MSESYEVTLGPQEWDFVPEYGDGKIKTRLRQITVEEYDDCIQMYSSRVIERSKMISYGLLEIKGLKVNGEDIIDAAGLLAASKALMPLFTEVWVEINRGSIVTEQESKNS